MKKNIIKAALIDYVPLAITVFCLIFFGIKEGQEFIKLLPCLVTCVVNFLTAHVNRVSFLIGAVNCIIYSIGYYSEGLYGSVASALLYSMPLQVVSFLMWKKNKYKQATIIKNMKGIYKLGTIIFCLVACPVSVYVFSSITGSRYYQFDGITFILGFVASMYIMFGFLDGVVINITSQMLSIVMWIIIVSGNPADITYLILSLYTFTRLIQTIVNWIKLYREQSRLKSAQSDNISAK